VDTDRPGGEAVKILGLVITTGRRYLADMSLAVEAGEAAGRIATSYSLGRVAGDDLDRYDQGYVDGLSRRPMMRRTRRPHPHLRLVR
jgi:hypothetical protein